MDNSKDKIPGKKKGAKNLLLDFLKLNVIVFAILWITTLLIQGLNLKEQLVSLSSNLSAGLFVSSILGGLAMGNPSIGYVLGKEALEAGASLPIIGTFIIAWITVGFTQIPVESKYFGKEFAIIRNALGILFSIVFGLIIWLTL